MTYIHPNLKTVVPKELRKEIYEKAISFEGKATGLCLRLPVILWNLESYMSRAPNDEPWDFEDTTIAFPELNEERLKRLYSCILEEVLLETRIEILNEMIDELPR